VKYTIALAGNPNSGKTTTFNELVGAKEKIGNWSGTTVERKEGLLVVEDTKIRIIDLPGTYSLTAYSIDERIARDFLVKEAPDLVVVIIDASNLERNLYLPLQLLEMGQNVVLVLNMMDVVKHRGIEIDVNALSEILDIPVVETVASQAKGMNILKSVIAKTLDKSPKILNIDYQEVEGDIKRIEEALEGVDLAFDKRTLGIKILEGDQDIFDKLNCTEYFSKISALRNEIIESRSDDIETFMIERRYAYIKGLVKECSKKYLTWEERVTRSDKIDEVLTNRFLGIPIFLSLMFVLFTFVFRIGEPFVGIIEKFFSFLGQQAVILVENTGWPLWIASLASDGIIAGVGSVLAFLPYICLLFLGISILEDSGYLARAAFVMDQFMHALGLHGKSFVPMLLGFGCTVPAVMATRTLGSEKDRILTILVLPLMSCAARLPVYTLFAAALFPENQGLIVFSLYLLGIILAVIMARVFRGVLFKGETAPLVMELPPYHIPNLKSVLLHMWIRSWLFIKKAGTMICLAVIFIWVLASLPWGVEYASENSVAGKMGSVIAPIFKPAGFGFWQAAVALVLGIFAKEVVVGTLGTLYGVGESGLSTILPQHFSPLSGYAFLVMTLVYIPCIASIAVIKQELNWKWAGLSVSYTLVLGWILSVLVYQVGGMIIK